jgi:hypothetical protein
LAWTHHSWPALTWLTTRTKLSLTAAARAKLSLAWAHYSWTPICIATMAPILLVLAEWVSMFTRSTRSATDTDANKQCKYCRNQN